MSDFIDLDSTINLEIEVESNAYADENAEELKYNTVPIITPVVSKKWILPIPPKQRHTL